MGSIDLTPIVRLAYIGIAAVCIGIVTVVIAIPFGVWWLWNHITVAVR